MCMKVEPLRQFSFHFESVVLMTVGFMWLMPFGGFDPAEIGFYCA